MEDIDINVVSETELLEVFTMKSKSKVDVEIDLMGDLKKAIKDIERLLDALHPFSWVYEMGKKKGEMWIDALDYITLPDVQRANEIYREFRKK